MIQLGTNEKLFVIFRKHWFAIFFEIFGLFLLALLPIALHILANVFVYNPIDSEVVTILGFLYVLYLVTLWIIGFMLWLDYYLDVLVVSNQRVIEIQQHGLFSREISSLNLENIQDVTTESHGIIQTLFKLGDIHVQTSGAQREVSMPNLAHPEYVKHVIMDLHNQMLNRVKSVRIEDN